VGEAFKSNLISKGYRDIEEHNLCPRHWLPEDKLLIPSLALINPPRFYGVGSGPFLGAHQ
jgi:hypothetical protein